MAASIFETMTTLFAGPETALDWKFLHRFWETLAQTGTPVSLDALAQELHCTRSKVVEVLDQYPEAEYDQFGHLVGLGLTLRPTVHQLLLEERSCYTWCAPDALLLPVVLGRPARIVSTCPVTGTRIEVTLTPDHLEGLSPANAVVSIAKDGGMLKKLKETGCIRQGGCENQFFFASQEVVAPWVSEHADFIVFPVAEAFQGLREFARQQRTLAARA